ncbi:MAG TPA: polysaccharide deacetylase family protein [Rickettsiales bacterium]|nr:polysaccharide deacetylase family protein [Rickettsiales bacterium]
MPARQYKTYENTNTLEKALGKLHQIAACHFSKSMRSIPQDFRCVSICFDDFPETAAIAGAAALEEAGAKGTFYTCFGQLGENSPGGVLATAEQVTDLAKRGHEIGCHTYDHINCSFESTRRVTASCERNIEAAAAHNLKLANFSYPQWGMSLGAKKLVQQHYDSARSGIQGINAGESDLYCLKSVPLYERNRETVRNLIDQVATHGGWLIIYTHDVSNTPSEHGISPASFKGIIRHCVQKGIPLKTIADALKSLNADGRRSV